MTEDITKRSKFLSLVLRHKPETIGLILDPNGWADVKDLLAKTKLNFNTLVDIVNTNNKKRFAFNEDMTKIRANQGHSIEIDLALQPAIPPDILYHGTATRFLDSIKSKGLVKGSRQHVHLSSDIKTAISVGSRHGKPIVLTILALEMTKNGQSFFQSENGVWLTDFVAPEFIKE